MSDQVTNTTSPAAVEADTITFTLPARIKVTGARKLEGELDMSKATNASLIAALDYWYGVVTQRASAGVEAYADKVAAEKAMSDKLSVFDWSPGSGGGGGKSVTDEQQAERNVLFVLFTSQGIKKGEATKRSKAANGWDDFLRLAMSRAENRTDLSDEEIQAERLEQQPDIDVMVADALAEIQAERQRNAKMATGLTFGRK